MTEFIQISRGKTINFLWMWPLYLRNSLRAVLGFCLYGNITRTKSASYTVSVRKPPYLPPASFRFAVTRDTLAIG
ncbi:MAG: hypothetical protein EOP48_11540 [Sphingobacteriales bacterium]|nr:MAG: hypothetical protein EOP48_11540 [Sphingobacteriales bacterium]